tara:strand:+ start:5382 stop:6314 length:933 start_codon:yes stop_codon:yes gene_type:complete
MKRFNKGILIISLDTELALGHLADNERKIFDSLFYKTKPVIKRLLALFKKYDISVTWAIVGKLIENVQEKEIDFFYKNDKICQNYLNENSDIYSYKNLINDIRCFSKKHDIGSHSYSHITFGPGRRNFYADNELAAEDFSNNNSVFINHKISPISFVFPQNISGHFEILRQFKFKVFRGEEYKWYNSFKGIFRKILKFIDNILPISPSVSLPKNSDGLIETNGNLHFAKVPFGYRKYIPFWILKIKLFLGLQKAIRKNKIFHLWTHPYDLTFREESHFQLLEWFLKISKKYSDEGRLKIITMKDLNQYYD